MSKKEYIKIPEYAEMVGLSSQYVRRIISKGIITKAAVKKKGKRFLVDPVQANIDREKNHAPENRKKPKSKQKQKLTDQEKETVSKKAGTDKLDYAECRRLNEQYKAGLKKLDYDKKSEELISADEVEREYFNIARTVRDYLLNIPGRISAILAAENDEDKVSEILNEEIRQSLEVLSK